MIRRRSVLALGSAAGTAALLGWPRSGAGATAAAAYRAPAELRWTRLGDGTMAGVLVAERLGRSTAAALPGGRLEGTPVGYRDGAGSAPASSPGPLLRFVEGVRYRLRFENRLPAMTNLHLHGLRIAPAVDAPFREIPPGGSAVYEFRLPAGSAATYWYHPHLHMHVEAQMLAGLVGPILVDPPAHRRVHALAAAYELPLLLQPAADLSAIAANGAARLRVAACARRLRLRLVNAAADSTVSVSWHDAAGRVQPVFAVASDAGVLPHPQRKTSVSLPPGGRTELLVDTVRPGRLRAAIAGGPAATVLETPAAAAGLTLQPPTGPLTHLPALAPGADATVRRIVLGLGPYGLTIDGRQFAMDRDDVTAPFGALEVWEVQNTTADTHPFHLHSYPVQVLPAGSGVGESAWRDVIPVPPHSTVRLAVPLLRYRGRTVFHCHIAGHEDSGMMAVLHVV